MSAGAKMDPRGLRIGCRRWNPINPKPLNPEYSKTLNPKSYTPNPPLKWPPSKYTLKGLGFRGENLGLRVWCLGFLTVVGLA